MSKYAVETLYGQFSLKPERRGKTEEATGKRTKKKQKKNDTVEPVVAAQKSGAKNPVDDEFFLYGDELVTEEGDAFYDNFLQLEERLLPIDDEKQHWEAIKGRIRCLQRETGTLRERQSALGKTRDELSGALANFEKERRRVKHLIQPQLEGRDFLKEVGALKRMREERAQALVTEKNKKPVPVGPTPSPVTLVDTVIAQKLCQLDKKRFCTLLSHLKTSDLLWLQARDQSRYSIYAAELQGYLVYVRVRVSEPADRHYIVIRSDLLVDSATGLVK